MNTTPPPHPVITQNGFKVFAHDNGRYSHAVTVNDVRLYARDYPAGAMPVEAALVEPGELEFVRAMGWKR